MRRLAVFLIVLAALALGALWIVPRQLDWEEYRGRLAALAADELGRPVALQGAVRVTLLPQPMVEADEVIVGGSAPDDLRLAARALRLRLDLGALLRLRLAPREVVLVGAEIRLPWPPQTTPALRPPPWLTTFEARIENSRVIVGDVVLEGVSANLTAGGALEAIRAEGGFAWRGTPVTFRAVVGRPGFDGIATLELGLAAGGAGATARGVLVEEGGFEGRVEAGAPDLAAFLGVPPGAFRVAGQLTIGRDVIAVREAVFDYAGVPGRGMAGLRLSAEPRFDVAVQTSRFDLDAWLAAFRAAPVSPLALNLEVAADAASFRGVSLRRLRGGISREGARLTLSDVAMLLPGDAELELEGTTAGARLELAARAAGPNLRETLLALGLPLEAVDAGRLRRFEARGRLALAEAEIGVSDLAASVDGTRMTGAVAFRPGARPHLGIGIELDRVELDGLLPAPPSPAALAAIGLDANLRITAGRVRLREVVLEPLALDAALENGRLLVRRLATRMRGADIAAAGVLSTAPAPRLSDASAEVTAADARGLLALLPAAWRPAEGFGAQPVALRLALSGAPEALGVRAEGQLGDLRIEAEGQLDLPQRRLAGTTQLHHPGAQRLIALAHGQEPPHWLGAGSFSLIASLSLSPEAWNAESFALVAGELRADGRASLAWGGARPRLTGRLRFDILPLPDLAQDAAAPLGLERLGLADAELAIEAGRIQGEGLPPVADLRGGLTLTDGTLHLAWTEGRLHGGPMEGALRIAGLAQPPRVEGHVTVAGLVITGPLLGLPLDLSAGVLDGALEGRATGHSLTALLGTLSGEARMVLRDGVLRGVALAAVPAVADLPDAAAAEAALRLALEGGATALDRLDAPARLADGRAMIETARLVAQGGTLATLGGVVDLARGSLDLTLRVAMPGEAPDVGLRITGPVATPRRLPDLSPWLRWRAER